MKSFLVPVLVLTGIVCLAHACFAQSGSDDADVERTVEIELEDDAGDSGLSDELDQYKLHPMFLLNASSTQLARLPGITITLADRILAFVRDSLPTSFTHLRSVHGLTARQLSVLRTYTTLKRPRGFSDTLLINLRSRIVQDLQPRKGYNDNLWRIRTVRDANRDSVGLDTISLGPSYLGSPTALTTRLLLAYREFSTGLTFEKDAGEPFLVHDTSGYAYRQNEHVDPAISPGDVRTVFGGFISGHLAAAFPAWSVVLGDYSAEWGQGLTLWTGFGGGKSGDAVRAPYKSARGITPYRSTGEALFLRGAAITLNEDHWLPRGLQLSLFGSLRTLDANLYRVGNADGDTVAYIGSISEDGYHRTHTELRRSNTLDERLIGGNLRYTFGNVRFGITGYTANSSATEMGTFFYDYSGSRVTNLGVDAEYRSGDLCLYGEATRSTTGTFGAIGGVTAMLGRVGLSVSGRFIPASFYSPHGVGFGESALRQHNEQGLYIGWTAPVGEQLHLTGYMDLYRFPERTYSVPLPFNGTDCYLEGEYRFSPRFRLLARLRNGRKGDAISRADTFGRTQSIIIGKEKVNGRIEAEYEAKDGSFGLRGRFERTVMHYNDAYPMASGMMTYGELRYRPIPSIALGMRLAMFATDNYDVAMYAYEQEIPGRSAVAALSGEGQRMYVFASWKPLPGITITAKYSETRYTDRTIINPNDLQQINGPLTNTFAVQIEAE